MNHQYEQTIQAGLTPADYWSAQLMRDYIDEYDFIKRRSRMDKFSKDEKLILRGAGLVKCAIDRSTYDLFHVTIHLRPGEPWRGAISNFIHSKRWMDDLQLSYVGVNVPSDISVRGKAIKAHVHLVVAGIPITCEAQEIAELIARDKGRRAGNSMYGQSVYNITGLMGYLGSLENLGMPNSGINSSMDVITAATEIGTNGPDVLKDYYWPIRRALADIERTPGISAKDFAPPDLAPFGTGFMKIYGVPKKIL